MKLVNLGCGSRYFENWINFDFVSNSKYVNQCNLNKGIPLAGETVDFVYHSHVLEHFNKPDAISFVKECHRILKADGVIRIVVPDLERIAINYLEKLNKVRSDSTPINKAEYDWTVLELLDQSVREESGGEMLKEWRKEEIINENQIIDRVGDEFIRLRKNILATLNKENLVENLSIKTKLKNFILKKLNVDLEDLRVGKFRNSGEIHKWMYDSHSLQELLIENGFRNIKIVDAFTSYLNNWEAYQMLDVENGKTRKPDSLFIEAYK